MIGLNFLNNYLCTYAAYCVEEDYLRILKVDKRIYSLLDPQRDSEWNVPECLGVGYFRVHRARNITIWPEHVNHFNDRIISAMVLQATLRANCAYSCDD